MPFDKRTLVVPKGTRFEERTISTHGDVILADDVAAAYGIATEGRIFLGERVGIGGDLTAIGDVRADMFCRLLGNVTTGGSCALGEKTSVKGKLSVAGDLDVGDAVGIDGGFEASGWINIRSPIPMVIYLFIYLLQMMGQGKSEEVERILRELEGGDEPIHVSETFFYVPAGSALGLQESTVKGNLQVADECRILGNLQVRGNASVGSATTLHGALRADGDVTLGDHARVHGDLRCQGVLVIGNGCQVLGSVSAARVEMRQTATIEGTIQAKGGIRFLTPEYVEMRQRVSDFRSGRPELGSVL